MNWRGYTPKLYRLVPQFYKSGCAVITLVDVTMSVLGHCSLVPEFIHWIDRCLFVADISLVVFMSVRLCCIFIVYYVACWCGVHAGKHCISDNIWLYMCYCACGFILEMSARKRLLFFLLMQLFESMRWRETTCCWIPTLQGGLKRTFF